MSAAAATTIAAIATAAAAIPAEATSATAAAIFAWFGFIDFQRTAADFLAIELLNRCIGFVAGGHFDEGEPSRASGVAIFDDTCGLDRTGLRKQFLKILTGSLESEVSNIEFCRHRDIPFPAWGGKEAANRMGFGETVAIEG